MLAADVAVLMADAENRRDRDIRKLVVLHYAFYELLTRLSRADALLHIQMQHRAAGIGALQLVLHRQRLERIASEICRKLRRISVVDVFIKSRLDDICVALLILLGEAIRSALGRRGFEIV